jgi:hypothetical protein
MLSMRNAECGVRNVGCRRCPYPCATAGLPSRAARRRCPLPQLACRVSVPGTFAVCHACRHPYPCATARRSRPCCGRRCPPPPTPRVPGLRTRHVCRVPRLACPAVPRADDTHTRVPRPGEAGRVVAADTIRRVPRLACPAVPRAVDRRRLRLAAKRATPPDDRRRLRLAAKRPSPLVPRPSPCLYPSITPRKSGFFGATFCALFGILKIVINRYRGGTYKKNTLCSGAHRL